MKTKTKTLAPELLRKMDSWWRAANYLSVGQIYLQENPLLDVPLTLAHVKPRLLGHWGTTPGLNLLYVHLNRLIAAHDLNLMLVVGPGHGGPGIVASTYLEETVMRVTSSTGTINGLTVAAGDVIAVALKRMGNDTSDTNTSYFHLTNLLVDLNN